MVIDMKYERTELMKTAVPELQDYCSQLGLQFQLVDLHWGVSVAEHSWTAGGFSRQLRQTEISDCQRLSIGPHFVVIICFDIIKFFSNINSTTKKRFTF